MQDMTHALVLIAALAASMLGKADAAQAPTTARPVALVTAESENALIALALRDGRVLRRVSLPDDPENIDVGDGGTALVVSTRAGAVTLVDSRSLRVITVLRGFRSPHIAAKAPGGEWAYVTDDAAGELTVIDLAEARVVSRLVVGLGAHHLAVSPNGRRLWVALGERARTIVVVDIDRPDRPRVLRRFDPGSGVHDLAFSPDGKTVWTTSDTGRDVEVLSARTRRLRFSVPVGAPPQHVVFNRRFAYVTSGYEGRIEKVEPWSGRVLRTATVPYGSFNLGTAGSLVVTSSLLRGTVTELNGRLRVLRTKTVAATARDVAVVLWK
jgi:DNA-binding beta-propeller fold protein YncE